MAPDILRRLGEELNPTPDQGIIELVKNAYDADATKCLIELSGTENVGGSVKITDNGDGLTDKDIIDGWLVLGRSRKSQNKRTRRKRVPAGNKGLGRLAALRLGNVAVLQSRPAKDPKRQYEVRIDWSRFEKADTVEDVPLTVSASETPLRAATGTTITLENLNVRIGRAESQRLARSLVLLADPFTDDPEAFHPILQAPDFEDLERLVKNRYFEQADFHLSASVDRNGWASAKVTDWRGTKLWSAKHSDLAAGTGFERYDCPPATFDLWSFLLNKENFGTRSVTLKEVREWLALFGGVHLYQNGLRVNPYGNPGNDWLDLNLRRARSPEERPSTNNSIGRVAVTDTKEALLQKTDRSGFVETDTFVRIREFAQDAVEWFVARRMEAAQLRRKKTKAAAHRAADAAKVKFERAIETVGGPAEEKLRSAFAVYDRSRDYEVEELQRDVQLYRTLSTAGITAATFAHESAGNALKVMVPTLSSLDRDARRLLSPADYDKRFAGQLRTLQESVAGLDVLARTTLGLLQHEKRRVERVDLHEVIKQILETYAPFFHSRDVKLKNELALRKRPLIRATRAAIESVVTNVLNNALTAFDHAKTRVRTLRIRSEVVDSTFRLHVADSGPGIKGIAVKDVWLAGKTTQPNGTGLGLAIVHDAVTDLGGQVAAIAHSDLGGAEFVITLPVLGA